MRANKASRWVWIWAIRPCFALLCLLALSAVPVVQAQQDSVAHITAVKLEPTKVGAAPAWSLAAEFDVHLGQKLREALDRGLPLRFVVDLKLRRQRWYWMDEETVSAAYTYNLSYHALTRTYRLVTPVGTFSASQFDEVMHNMERLSDWVVIRKDQVVLGEQYKAHIRFRLALTELPKPFQISALVNSDWDLSSDWLAFDFTPRHEALK